MRLPILLAGLLAMVTPPLWAQDRPTAMTICHEDDDSYPWVMKNSEGLDIKLVKLLEKQLKDVRITTVAVPWKRCLAELQQGKVDGAMAASFKADRLEMGLYPTGADGKPDAALRLHMGSYSMYVAKGADLGWDGSKFSNLKGSIGIQSGFSIGDFLKKAGAQVDDGTKSAGDNLKKVVLGRLQGAALLTLEGDHLIATVPELAGKIDKLKPPLEEKPYYVMLSKSLVQKYPAFAKEFWNGVAKTRESADFKKAEEQFFKK